VGLIARLRGLFKRKPKVVRDQRLRAFDTRIAELAGRGAELRRSAATLLATRGELERSQDAAQARAKQCRTKAASAKKSGENSAHTVLLADAEAADAEARGFAEQILRLDEDARAIGDTTRKIEAEVASLRQELSGAEARLTAAAAVTSASKAMAEKADQLRSLDEARDGVEHAKALADVYREDLDRKR